jgi:hypothetical protein
VPYWIDLLVWLERKEMKRKRIHDDVQSLPISEMEPAKHPRLLGRWTTMKTVV